MKIAFAAASSPIAQKALAALTKKYGQSKLASADYVVALGGDGQVLKTLYEVMGHGKPVFAMRRTESIGFLCNEFRAEGLEKRLSKAQKVILHPLHLEARTVQGKKTTISWVWDVYDADHQRAMRLVGEEVGASGRTAWNAADDQVLNHIARDGMTRLAAFLTDPSAPAPSPAQAQPNVAFLPGEGGILAFAPTGGSQ